MSGAVTSETFDLQNYVAGTWRRSTASEFVDVVNPATAEILARTPLSTNADVDAAVQAAADAFPVWRRTPPGERVQYLFKLKNLLEDHVDEIARLTTIENGKTFAEAKAELRRGIENVEVACGIPMMMQGYNLEDVSSGIDETLIRQPLGVVAAITPFNFPLNLTLHKLAPALAAGNAVVHKPAERTPLSALRLAHLVTEAGTPRGAYNIVTGDGPALAAVMLQHPDIAMITFTGSMRVGTELRAKAGLKRITLELGNNSAAIIEPDADLAIAVSRSVQGAFTLSGQSCISLQRAFVHESIANEYVERLVAETKKLRLGHPYESSTDISSLIDEPAAIRVESWIQEAVHSGARLLCGGKRRHATIEPAVLTSVPASARISCEEVFGPVIAVYPYQSLEDAIALANRTPYGLQAGIFTRDIARAFAAARKLQFGGVLINDIPTFRMDHMPYGGAKHSGLGREGPRYAIEEMTEMKLICWKTE